MAGVLWLIRLLRFFRSCLNRDGFDLNSAWFRHNILVPRLCADRDGHGDEVEEIPQLLGVLGIIEAALCALDELSKNTLVRIRADGHCHAVALGRTAIAGEIG